MDTPVRNHPSIRWDTTKQVHRIRLTDNRLDMLMAFFVHGYLSTGMLHALVAPSKTQQFTTEELRLMKLPPNEYLEQSTTNLRRRAQPLSSELIYRITAHGVEALLRYSRIAPEDAELWTKLRAQEKQNNYWHDVATSFVTASMAIGARDLGLKFLSIYDIMRSAPETTKEASSPLSIPYEKKHFIPDALFGIKDEITNYFAVEMDMGSEQTEFSQLKNSTLSGKYRAYRHMWANDIPRKQFNLPNLKLLIPTTMYLRTSNLKKAFAEIAKNDTRTKGTGPAYLRCLPALDRRDNLPLPSDGTMLLNQWERVNGTPVYFYKKTADNHSAA